MYYLSDKSYWFIWNLYSLKGKHVFWHGNSLENTYYLPIRK